MELRKGKFSYFSNTASSSSGSSKQEHSSAASINNHLKRKDIQLEASTCTCRALKSSPSKGFAFEIRIQGGKRRLWIANTAEERQAWIQAIHNSMMGTGTDAVTRGDNYLQYQTDIIEGSDKKKKKKKQRSSKKNKKKSSSNTNVSINSPYKTFLEQYLEVRSATSDATSKIEYLTALHSLRGKSITVPVQYIKSQVHDETSPAHAASFVETEISSSVQQLWKDLARDSVNINNEILNGEAFHGVERIVGKLTQQILKSSEILLAEERDGNNSSALRTSTNNNRRQRCRILEAQAVSYARDILLACSRTRSGGDSYFCAENLCVNRNLVVLCPASLEATPISIQVSEQTNDSSTGIPYDISGWVYARSNPNKPWKKQYLLLSTHGVLSCYAQSEPKPHQLTEIMLLNGAVVDKTTNVVEQQESAAKSKKKSAKKPPPGSSSDELTTIRHIVKVATKDGQIAREFYFEDEDSDFSYWYESLKKSACVPQQDKKHSNENGHGNNTSDIHSTTPAVDVEVNVCTEYKMCTIDPSGVESEDNWVSMKTSFVQKFSLTGGVNGRIARGDEAVQLELL